MDGAHPLLNRIVEQLRERRHPGARAPAHHEHLAHRRQRLAQLGRHRDVIEAPIHGRDEPGVCVGEAREMADFGMAMRRQCRYGNRAGLEAGEVGGHTFKAVGQLKDDAPARDDAASGKMEREPLDHRAQLAISDAAFAVDDGQARGILRNRTVEAVANRLAAPVTEFSIKLRSRLRPRHHTLEHQELRRLW